ncbi:hypothetical protein B8V81_3952 [Paenibacillus pasadenensis]|uniref:Uncharacterized protein n=1 Tax=Paenibacillus pasadenensis TaxID=217090 RepID=A0A2N5N598_9BACL|nr:hypothetical protein B8V81_3952 [Paenibacillus pasadenensis]
MSPLVKPVEPSGSVKPVERCRPRMPQRHAGRLASGPVRSGAQRLADRAARA